MSELFRKSTYHFRKLSFEKYHHTDNRCGSPENYIGYMLKGRAEIVSDKSKITANAGDLFFIPYKLSYQSYWYGERVEFLSIGFSDIEADEKMSFALQKISCDESIKRLVKQIPINVEKVTCEALAAFYGALSKIIPVLKESRHASAKDDILKRAKKYIKENTDSSIADIAKHCYISEPYLFRIFSEKADCTPNEYRLKCKCAKGREYLLTTDKTVEEISESIGFSSAAHFRRALKKYTGLTPKEIRKKDNFAL